MRTCPICAKPLKTVRQREGLFYPCDACGGRAVTLSQVRHVLGDIVATKLLRLIKLSRRVGARACPFCGVAMLVVHAEQPPLELDACRNCNAVWFDQPTYDSLPQLTLETLNSRTMQATEIIALERLEELKKKMEEERKAARKKKRILHRGADSLRRPPDAQ